MPSRTEILRAIKDAEQIANDLDCGQASFAKNTFLREDCRKPLIAAYNELYQAAGPQARITIKLKHLLSVMGRMYADALPSRYADSIRGYCSEIRDYLTDHTTGDREQTTVQTGRATAAELIGMVSPDAAKALLIVEKPDWTYEQKIQALRRLDERYEGYNGPQWSKMLGCTEQRARQILQSIAKKKAL